MNSSSSLFCFSLVCTVLLNCLCIFVFEWQVNKRTLAHIHFHYQCSHIKSICCYLHSVIITILPFYKLFAFIDKFTPLFRLKYNVSLLLVVKSRRNSLEKKNSCFVGMKGFVEKKVHFVGILGLWVPP